MILEELICPIVQTVISYDDLTEKLKVMGENSNTAKMWIDAFVIPMLTLLIYIRAEKEGCQTDAAIHFRRRTPQLCKVCNKLSKRHVRFSKRGNTKVYERTACCKTQRWIF